MNTRQHARRERAQLAAAVAALPAIWALMVYAVLPAAVWIATHLTR